MRSRRRREQGNVFIESALVLTSFLLVMIGIVDLAQILYVNQALKERVRGVARASAINGATPEAVQNMIAYGSPEGPPQESAGSIAPSGFMGLQPHHIGVQILDRTFNEHRLVVTVRGLPVTIVSPLIAGRGQNLPLRITVPLEAP